MWEFIFTKLVLRLRPTNIFWFLEKWKYKKRNCRAILFMNNNAMKNVTPFTVNFHTWIKIFTQFAEFHFCLLFAYSLFGLITRPWLEDKGDQWSSVASGKAKKHMHPLGAYF